MKGSSAMPHKRNPKVAERICGLARVVRAAALVGLENVPLWHERDISQSSAERDRDPRRVPRARLHARPLRLDRRGPRRLSRADAARTSTRATASSSATACCSRSSSPASPRDEAYRLVQGTRCAPGRRSATSASSSRPTPRSPARVDLDAVFDLDATVRHVDTVFERLRALAARRSPSMSERPCTSEAARSASCTRSTTTACCSSPATASRPSTSCCRRRSPTRAACSPGLSGVLVRAHAGDRPEPPARAAARRPLDGVPAARDAADRVRRPRLPRRLGLEGLPRDRRGLRPPRCRPGLRESEQLPEPIFTPATKAEEGHDENIDRATRRPSSSAPSASPRSSGSRSSSTASPRSTPRERGIVLADTKLEFGVDPEGRLVLGDEAFTPDSSRFWPADEYEPGGAAALVRQAVRARLLRVARLGQGRPRARSCRTTSSPARARATSRRSSA